MKVRSIAIGTVLTILALSFNHGVSAEPPTQAAMQEFAAQYKKATSETERMQLAINAINSGLIYKNMPVEDADVLFATNFKAKIPSKGSYYPLEVGLVIFFSPASPPPGPWGYAVQTTTHGWYLALIYNELGLVENYVLTNVNEK